LKKGKNGEVYNVGTGRETSILELAKTVIDITDIDIEPVFERPREEDIRRSYADMSKAKKLGFELKTNLRRDFQFVVNSNSFSTITNNEPLSRHSSNFL